jgi:hypothetical protein
MVVIRSLATIKTNDMKIKILTVILTLIFSFTFWSNTEAKCRRVATVKYQQQYGWSKKYEVEVTFMTGMELNQATNSFNYSVYSVYAIIFWGEGQASVIKLTSYLLCGYEVTCDCIGNSIYNLQGYDQDGDKWNICLGDYCY